MKKISRRSFLTAAAACGAAAALSACGGSSASSTAASSTAGSTAASAAAGPVTLQWSVWDKESSAIEWLFYNLIPHIEKFFPIFAP